MTRRPLPTVALVLVLAAANGCQPLGVNAPKPPQQGPIPLERTVEKTAAAAPANSALTPGRLRPEEFPAEIAALESTSRNPQATDAQRAEALRRLALLHLAPDNPSRNPALAAEAQTAYLNMQPAGTARQEGEIWLALIMETLGREELLRQSSASIRAKDDTLAELGAEKQRLAQKLAALEAANAKLKADIEKLKFIDLSVEKKRKSFR